MKKLTRILTMGGFGLLAAMATAGPANAATATHTPESKSGGAHQAQWGDGDQVVGFYRTLRNCELAGRSGERVGKWDDHDCSPVRIGIRRGAWALQVDSDDDWDNRGFGVPFGAIRSFPGQYRPVWPGAFRPSFGPGFGHPGSFGHPGGFGHPGPIFGGPGRSGPIFGGQTPAGPTHPNGPMQGSGNSNTHH